MIALASWPILFTVHRSHFPPSPNWRLVSGVFAVVLAGFGMYLAVLDPYASDRSRTDLGWLLVGTVLPSVAMIAGATIPLRATRRPVPVAQLATVLGRFEPDPNSWAKWAFGWGAVAAASGAFTLQKLPSLAGRITAGTVAFALVWTGLGLRKKLGTEFTASGIRRWSWQATWGEVEAAHLVEDRFGKSLHLRLSDGADRVISDSRAANAALFHALQRVSDTVDLQ